MPEDEGFAYGEEGNVLDLETFGGFTFSKRLPN